MSVENWKLEKDLCRCCLSEGTFQNLAEPCMNQGAEEIYSDMLIEGLDVNLTPVSGPLCTSTYTICEECILRLRDACSFKRQVLLSEKRFRELYSKDIIKCHSSVKKEAPDSDNEGGPVKQEMMEDDDDYRHYDDDDDGELKSEIEVNIQEVKKAKTRKPKAKEKPKPKKRAGRPRKPQTDADAEADVDEELGEGTNDNKGKRPDYYTIRGGEYACNTCDRTFASQPLVSQHHRFVHLKRRPKDRKCPKCDQKIPGHLRAYHLEEAHGIPAPTCGVCQKKFRFPCQVLQHQRKVHMRERTITCTVCSKGFFDQLSLRSHMLTHGSKGRFKCDLCSQQFRWKNNLKDHMLVHMKEKRFVCHCGKAFVQKSSLKQHVQRNHFNR